MNKKIPSLEAPSCYKRSSPSGFSMRRLRHILVIVVASLALRVVAADPMAQPQNVWDFDSIAAPSALLTANQLAAKQINDTLLGMVEKWNAHDLDGYLDFFWRSPALVFLEDGAAINGWQELSDKYHRSFSDRNNMGRCSAARVQVRMLTPETAFVVTSWTIAFPGTKTVIVGIDSNYVQRIGGAWKVTLTHSSQLEI